MFPVKIVLESDLHGDGLYKTGKWTWRKKESVSGSAYKAEADRFFMWVLFQGLISFYSSPGLII